MGIYYGDEIRGVRIINRENTAEILYESIYKQKMTAEELELFFLTYETYSSRNPLISIYVEITTTYENPPQTYWIWEIKHTLQELKDFCYG